MANDPENKSSNQGEIDLLYVFVKLGELIRRTITNLFKYAGLALLFLLRKWYYFAIAILLTLGSAWLINRSSDSFYRSSLDMRSNVISNQPIMSRIDQLGVYANTKNYSALSKWLGLTPEESQNIKQIETYWYYDIDDDGRDDLDEGDSPDSDNGLRQVSADQNSDDTGDDGSDDIDRTGFLGGLTPISAEEESSLIGNWED